MHVLAVLVLTLACCRSQELFKNPDFEESFGRQNWWCSKCTLSGSTDAFRGTRSGMVTDREKSFGGVTQDVDLVPGKTYHYIMQIKLLNQRDGMMWHELLAQVKFYFSNGTSANERITTSKYMRRDQGWTKIGGDFTAPTTGFTRARFYIHLSEVDVNYLVDSASLTEIVEEPDWRTAANERIEQIRKRGIRIRLKAPNYRPEDLKIEVKQVRHDFPFGAAVKHYMITGSGQQERAYQDLWYRMFEWATVANALKWKAMEKKRRVYTIENGWNAVNVLRSNGIPVRGHNIIWGLEKNVPPWLLELNNTEFRVATNERVDHDVRTYKGKLEHWDVSNENLHGQLFEERFGDPLFTHTVFRRVHTLDPDVRLFFNDFAVLRDGRYTYAYLQQVKEATDNQVPVHGVGIQAHMNKGFNFYAVKKRLDILASSGVPLWITELTVPHEDRTQRAQGYEDLLRLFFSYPSVEGVILWGFWDGAHMPDDPTVALAEGENVQINAAGERFLSLVKGEWATTAEFRPTQSEEDLRLRGFHGNYNVTVTNKGQPVTSTEFYVGKGAGEYVTVLAL